MVTILGISDAHNASVTILRDGVVLGALEEERVNRIKAYRGFPRLAPLEMLRYLNLRPSDIDTIALAGLNTPQFAERLLRPQATPKEGDSPLLRVYNEFNTLTGKSKKIMGAFSRISSRIILRELGKMGFKGQKILVYDHHLCHAASAHLFSPFKKSLILTIDGQGDGISTGIFLGAGDDIELISSSGATDSIGHIYSNITHFLGFDKHTGPGKVMGLAAYRGTSVRNLAEEIISDLIEVEGLQIRTKTGGIFKKSFSKEIFPKLKRFSREEIAAGMQVVLERVAVRLTESCIEQYGIRNVSLAGGVALNVKMNKAISESSYVDDLFIFPNASDGGLSTGAAALAYLELTGNRVERLSNVYWGPSFGEDEIKSALRETTNLKVEEVDDATDFIVDKLVEGKTIARFSGREEFGPRALGNRSILANPSDKKIVGKLNHAMKRDEFMPFCPSFLEEEASKYLVNYRSSPYMIMCFDVINGHRIPAVVHVDNTVRPQTVNRESNPAFYRVLSDFYKRTSIPALLNTSYNLHGEPIVHSPKDAISSFMGGCGDFLVFDSFVAAKA